MVVSRLNDQIGRVLGGRYRLIAPIGTGASALVYLAEDTRLRRRVAVKLLHQALADDESFLRRFRAEAQAAAALSNPHILAVYDWGEDEHEPYLVTEYLGGGSLRAMLDHGTRLAPSQALMVGLETARALDFAHRRGFVHRDIKPANLLFGEEGRLRIADFGLARALAEAAWTEPAGAMIGTARYASPEQARGEAVSGRGDVYSLVLVLVEAVTGVVPFAADTTIATLMARVDRPIDVPLAMGPMRKVLTRAGDPDPAMRPDAGELAVGLLAAAEDLPRPEPLRLAGTAASAADVPVVERDLTQISGPPTATDTVAPPPVVPPPPAEVEAGRRPRGSRRWRKVVGAIFLVLALAGGAFAGYQVLHTPTHAVAALATREQAEAEAAAHHWKLVVNETRVDGTAAGQIVSQDPPQGKQLAEGKSLTITVSLGNTLVDVPQTLAKMPVAGATAALQAAGLVVGKTTEAYDETIPAGAVITIATGTPPQLARGSAVDLVVSKGPEPRAIPAVPPGSTYDQIAKALQGLGLKANKVEAYDDNIAAGQVVSTDPVPGTKVNRGSTVNVVVSKGLTPIPDVRGQSVADAIDALQGAGFTIDGVQGNPFRSVRNTSPPPGTQAKKGTAVTLITR